MLVIDEFQYLVSVNTAYPSIFQEAWDEILKESNVMVILCGSLISMMTSKVLSRSSPLYGRRTAQIRLQPLRFAEFRQAFPDKSFAELTELYAVTGGVPKYIEFFDNDLSLWENVSDVILAKSGFLYEEPVFLLEKEVRETVNYFSIMKAISLGNHKLSKIAGLLEQPTTSVSPYLATLSDLFLVEKRVPVTEQNQEKSRKGLYYICDYFIDFWFKFVYPHRGELEMDNTGYVLKKIQSAFIENHVSYVFEAISRENFAAYCAASNIDFVPSRIGAYWNGSTEIDVVAVDQEHDSIFAGECKYYDKPVPADVYFDLKKKCA
ncbi:MAG: ATP-binding protein, partial [Acutalibacteraceae bacterium]|nr:ATP-binding protein [Acutalibacteraceae bacterium]